MLQLINPPIRSKFVVDKGVDLLQIADQFVVGVLCQFLEGNLFDKRAFDTTERTSGHQKAL